MKPRQDAFNPKRKLQPRKGQDSACLVELASKVRYGGNPEHKRNPGDFGLTPPSDPRPGKSLCDLVGVFSRTEALKLLQSGLRSGLISDRFVGNWPKNIWSVMADGSALEAQLENSEIGSYHGYPMPDSDPFVQDVMERWRAIGEQAHE